MLVRWIREYITNAHEAGVGLEGGLCDPGGGAAPADACTSGMGSESEEWWTGGGLGCRGDGNTPLAVAGGLGGEREERSLCCTRAFFRKWQQLDCFSSSSRRTPG